MLDQWMVSECGTIPSVTLYKKVSLDLCRIYFRNDQFGFCLGTTSRDLKLDGSQAINMRKCSSRYVC